VPLCFNSVLNTKKEKNFIDGLIDLSEKSSGKGVVRKKRSRRRSLRLTNRAPLRLPNDPSFTVNARIKE
jgi:hypothetical protein